MRTIRYIISGLLLVAGGIFAQPGNDNCGAATVLTPNAGCTNGTVDAGTTQLGEVISGSCVATTFTTTVWYRFTANATSMYVDVEFTGLASGAVWCPGRFTAQVFGPNPTCLPAAASRIACENAGDGDGLISLNLTGLTVGATYYVQVGYAGGGGCQMPNFCIRVGNHEPNYGPCNPAGPACGFTTAPSVATVTSTCPADSTPELEELTTDTRCYTFTANNTCVDFNVIINSNCSGGNVSGFSWSLFQTGVGCPGSPTAIQTGTLASLTMCGLTIGTNYTFCYTFTVLADCHHSIHYPYFVGAVPFAIRLTDFQGMAAQNGNILRWSALDADNASFHLERSTDGVTYADLGEILPEMNKQAPDIAATRNAPVHDAQSGTGGMLDYEYTDNAITAGVSTFYYRLRYADNQGAVYYSDVVEIARTPVTGYGISSFAQDGNGSFTLSLESTVSADASIEILDITGKSCLIRNLSIKEGFNTISFNLESSAQGMYILVIRSDAGTISRKFTR